ncbi:hypothetical protein RI367_004584 [Sorochytrium milnesiophthora]
MPPPQQQQPSLIHDNGSSSSSSNNNNTPFLSSLPPPPAPSVATLLHSAMPPPSSATLIADMSSVVPPPLRRNSLLMSPTLLPPPSLPPGSTALTATLGLDNHHHPHHHQQLQQQQQQQQQQQHYPPVEATPQVGYSDQDQQAQLEACEAVIDLASLADKKDADWITQQTAFRDSVHAVKRIVDDKLYRVRSMGILEYFKQRFNISRAQVYRLADASDILRDLELLAPPDLRDTNINLYPLPARIRVCGTIKALCLTREDRQALWIDIVAQTLPSEVTSRKVTEVWERILARREKEDRFADYASHQRLSPPTTTSTTTVTTASAYPAANVHDADPGYVFLNAPAVAPIPAAQAHMGSQHAAYDYPAMASHHHHHSPPEPTGHTPFETVPQELLPQQQQQQQQQQRSAFASGRSPLPAPTDRREDDAGPVDDDRGNGDANNNNNNDEEYDYSQTPEYAGSDLGASADAALRLVRATTEQLQRPGAKSASTASLRKKTAKPKTAKSPSTATLSVGGTKRPASAVEKRDTAQSFMDEQENRPTGAAEKERSAARKAAPSPVRHTSDGGDVSPAVGQHQRPNGASSTSSSSSVWRRMNGNGGAPGAMHGALLNELSHTLTPPSTPQPEALSTRDRRGRFRSRSGTLGPENGTQLGRIAETSTTMHPLSPPDTRDRAPADRTKVAGLLNAVSKATASPSSSATTTTTTAARSRKRKSRKDLSDHAVAATGSRLDDDGNEDGDDGEYEYDAAAAAATALTHQRAKSTMSPGFMKQRSASAAPLTSATGSRSSNSSESSGGGGGSLVPLVSAAASMALDKPLVKRPRLADALARDESDTGMSNDYVLPGGDIAHLIQMAVRGIQELHRRGCYLQPYVDGQWLRPSSDKTPDFGIQDWRFVEYAQE